MAQDKSAPTSEETSQMNDEPTPPLPTQKLSKPGVEADMELRPKYAAPRYRPAGKLKGKVALITGGDSGIGRAVAVIYAREGADVAISYLPAEQRDAEETRSAVEAEGRRCLEIPGDICNPDFCREIVERTVRELGRLDVLVSNAAYQDRFETIEELPDEHWRHTFRVNIDAYFHLAKAAVPHMQPGSSIIATSSVVGLRGSEKLLDYGATKGAQISFSKSLAQQLASRGIRVNVVAPGPVWTPLTLGDRGAEPERIENFGGDLPMKRPAQPEELAPAYVFLASDADASFITGIVLGVMGGETMGG